MIPPEQIKKAIPENEALLGPNFHQKLAEKLNTALCAAHIDEAQFHKKSAGYDEGEDAPELPPTFYRQLEEMADQLCLHSQYEIPSHRGGFIGSLLCKIKWVILQIKLRTDVQVSQQAKFNVSVLVNLEFLAVQNEHQAKIIAALQKEIESLRGHE